MFSISRGRMTKSRKPWWSGRKNKTKQWACVSVCVRACVCDQGARCGRGRRRDRKYQQSWRQSVAYLYFKTYVFYLLCMCIHMHLILIWINRIHAFIRFFFYLLEIFCMRFTVDYIDNISTILKLKLPSVSKLCWEAVFGISIITH